MVVVLDLGISNVISVQRMIKKVGFFECNNNQTLRMI